MKIKGVITILLILFLLVGGYFLVQQVQQDQAPDDSSAAAVSNSFTVSLPNDLKGFDIYNPTPGKLVLQCTKGGKDYNEWYITQWSNDDSLCNGTATVPTCVGADMQSLTTTSSVCYTSAKKEFKFSLDASKMRQQGCNLHSNPINKANPGGYHVLLTWDSTKRADFWTSEYMGIKNLQKLEVSTGFINNSFSKTACPAGVVDPVLGGAQMASSMINVIATQVDMEKKQGKGSIFYQIVLYDNRVTSSTPITKPYYLNCGLQSSATEAGFIVATDIVGYYGKPQTASGTLNNYKIDVLPRLKYFINKCTDGKIGADEYRVTSVTFGDEIINSVKQVNTFIDPKVTFTLPAKSASTTNTCTTFTYSAWSSCLNNKQTRTVKTSSPTGCTGGSPVLSQSCTSPTTNTNTNTNTTGVACGVIDVNGDSKLTIVDFKTFLEVYGKTCKDEVVNTGCGGKDTNGDGKVDSTDFESFKSRYQKASCVL